MCFILDIIKMVTMEIKRTENKLKGLQKEEMIGYNDKMEIRDLI